MSRGVMACSESYTIFSTSINRRCSLIPLASRANPSFLNSNSFRSLKCSRINLRCNNTGDSGENGCKTMLDAFFLGKAIGEILNQRIESSVGEFLGVIGRLQTEQLKHISQFQAASATEEVTGLVSDATSTISSTTASIISEVSSSVLDRATEDPFLGLFNKD